MSTTRFARRITDTSEKSYGMVGLAMAEKGPLIHLELGRPMYDTPQHIKQATIDALLAGDVHYSDLQGMPELREALASKLARQNGINVGPSQIIVTNGLTQASFAAFMALLDDGDEAILLDPFYPQHIGKIEFAGATPVIAALDPTDNFSIKRELIEPYITAQTKVIVLVNPCNPTGRIYTRAELQVVADLAVENDLVVLTDEVYEQITFDGAQHISIASLPGMECRTVTMQAFTKAYAMDGWRIGYIVAPKDFIEPLMKVTTTEVTHVNTFIQHGALAAVNGPVEALSDMVDGDRQSRDFVVQRLNQMPGVTCKAPQGTIYAFPDISATGLKSNVIAMRLMHEVGVVVESGSFYGEAGEGHLRICFGAQPKRVLSEAMDKLQDFFNKL
ncbi:pyridoxal phosphate-dependent aminotransferase [Loktanella sp. DJP18]|uniref:pyridoxal phosphate-dependent aminotransferase n=1 Tax=Loktanella sp. DJP18 TaxID=3409788 RepID=UPI003BB541BB